MKIIIRYIFLVIIGILLLNSSNMIVTAKKKVPSKEEEISKYENIIFLGDSITEFYPIEEIYGNLPIVKSGIGGYKTDDLLAELEEMVYRYNPTSVYLLIGTNDLVDDEEEDKAEAIDNIKKIVERITTKRKKTKIYIESIYPVNNNLNKKAVGARNNDTIIEVNKEIEKYCKENKYNYIDMYKELADNDGNFKEKYTNDGLHPNDLGYAKITRVLLPYIYGLK